MSGTHTSVVRAGHSNWLIGIIAAIAIIGLAIASFAAVHQFNQFNTQQQSINAQQDEQAASLRCIENYEDARRARDILVLRISTARSHAIDNRNLAEDAALHAAIKHEPQRRILHLARIYTRKARIYKRVTRHYYEVLANHPLPKLKKFRCAEEVARTGSGPQAPTPTVTVTRTAPAPAPATVHAPPATVTVHAAPRTVMRTETVAPGKGGATATVATRTVTHTVTVTPDPVCSLAPQLPTC